MKYLQIPIKLTLIGPILTESSAAGELGIDSPVARNAGGDVVLPFSLVKGRVSQSWDELSNESRAANAEEWFGGGSGETTGNWAPDRGRFRFSDFVAVEGNRGGVTHRIRIDRRRGAADEGALQLIESPFAPGERVEFRGDVGWLARDDDPIDAADALANAFRWTSSYGAERTTGFGRVAGVDIGAAIPAHLSEVEAAEASAPDHLGLEIEILDPFCLAKRRIALNIFESEEVISGAVIRGVLATLFNQSIGRRGAEEIDASVSRWKALGQWFNEIRFTCAFPVAHDQDSRPVEPPRSLVKDQDGRWCDAALCDKPFVFNFKKDGAALYQAPAFEMDWKESDDVDAAFGWIDASGKAARPKRELRVRTAIDRKNRRAQDGKLFAYEMIVPRGFRWNATIDLSRVDTAARPQVLAELGALLSIGETPTTSPGLPGFGKSKARGRVTINKSPLNAYQRSSLEPIDGNLWVITLQTAALLCDPEKLDESSGEAELRAAYESAFDGLADGNLKLVRYFARQSLAGGEYLHHRFGAGEKAYNPFLLTDAGSVFVLRDLGEGKAFVLRWLQHGLELPDWAKARYDTKWQTNPFLPVDGFGEIAVNLECHVQSRPQPGTFVEIPAASIVGGE